MAARWGVRIEAAPLLVKQPGPCRPCGHSGRRRFRCYSGARRLLLREPLEERLLVRALREPVARTLCFASLCGPLRSPLVRGSW
jgi:hypothetical protein